MAEEKSRKEKALLEELEFYRNRKRIREGWNKLDGRIRKAIVLGVLASVIALSSIFYMALRSIAEPDILTEESYLMILSSKSGSSWTLSERDRSQLRDLVQLPLMKRKVSIGSSGNVLYLILSDDSVSLEFPFRLEDGTISGTVCGVPARLYFSESASGRGMALSLIIGSIEAELSPFSGSAQLQ